MVQINVGSKSIQCIQLFSSSCKPGSLFFLKLGVVTIDALAESLSAIAGEVCLDIGTLLNSLVQLENTIVLARLLELGHCLGERKCGAVNALCLLAWQLQSKRGSSNYLEEEQIDICKGLAVDPRPVSTRLGVEQSLNVAEKLGGALVDKHLGALLGLVLLVLVELRRGDRVMSVMHLIGESIEDRQSRLVEVVKRGLGRRRRQAELGREIDEDVGRLADDDIAVPEGGRGEHRRIIVVTDALGVDEGHDLGDSLLADSGVILVGDAGVLEQQSDELAAAGDAGPVDELVLGVVAGLDALCFVFGHGGLIGQLGLLK